MTAPRFGQSRRIDEEESAGEKEGDAIAQDVREVSVQPLLAIRESPLGFVPGPTQAHPPPVDEKGDDNAPGPEEGIERLGAVAVETLQDRSLNFLIASSQSGTEESGLRCCGGGGLCRASLGICSPGNPSKK